MDKNDGRVNFAMVTALISDFNYGIECRMTDMRKITAFVPMKLLQSAQDYTGAGVSETLRMALQQLAHAQACRQLLALRGKVPVEMNLDELRADREFDQHGNVI